jgi:hypothetical protein
VIFTIEEYDYIDISLKHFTCWALSVLQILQERSYDEGSLSARITDDSQPSSKSPPFLSNLWESSCLMLLRTEILAFRLKWHNVQAIFCARKIASEVAV